MGSKRNPSSISLQPPRKSTEVKPWCTHPKIAGHSSQPAMTPLMSPMLACGLNSVTKTLNPLGTRMFCGNKTNVGCAVCSGFSYQVCPKTCHSRSAHTMCGFRRVLEAWRSGFNLSVMKVFLYTKKAVGSNCLRANFYKSLQEQRRISITLMKSSIKFLHTLNGMHLICHRDPLILAKKAFFGLINHCIYVYIL